MGLSGVNRLLKLFFHIDLVLLPIHRKTVISVLLKTWYRTPVQHWCIGKLS